ncbi:MAG: acyltransferase 3 [Solirubrobacterales bacterium]|nr:acyltransferase 3 [Solirubrobacterales bacterium]
MHDAAGDRILQAGEVRSARLESLRALAALAVLTGHVWGGVHDYAPDAIFATFWRRLLLNGGQGVFLFFALSGYLLFWPFVRRHFGDGRAIDLGSYARNRALRILPLYFAAIVVLMILGGHASEGTLWWRHLLFVQAMWSDSLSVLDGPLWSVAVEIQFYVLLPLIAWLLAVVSVRRKAVAAGLLVAAGVLSAVARWKLDTHSANPGNPWAYQFPTTFLFFTGGMSLALLRQWMLDRGGEAPRGPLGSAALWALASVGCWLLATWHLDQDLWMAPAGFLLVGSLVLPLRRGRWAALLDFKPLALVGVASYSLYVWHLPLGGWLNWGGDVLDGFVPALIGVAAAAIAVALVSYRLIEAPFLGLRRRWGATEAAAAPAPTDV